MTKEEKKAYNAAYRAAHKEEKRAYDEAYYVANREKIAAQQAAYYAANPEKCKAYPSANPEKVRARHLQREYGISSEEFQRMLLQQHNACGICKEIFSKRPDVDHCHNTGKVRGLLCGSCNVGLGRFKDSVERLQKAIQYLQPSE